MESLSNPAAGTVIATVQQEPTSEDDADDDNDSGVGEDVESTTTSLSPSVQEYVHKYGRRYQTEVNWFAPNDEREQYRMDLRHMLSKETLGGCLFVSQDGFPSAPKVLDIGTGTGTWAMDMADKYGGEVIGTDLSPIQPRWVPPNCSFLVDDAGKPWEDPKTYNFIHLRDTEGAFENMPWIFEQAMTALDPGGIIEIHGLDFRPYAQAGEVTEEIQTWISELHDLTEKRGTPMNVTNSYEPWMRAAGFAEVEKHEFIQPLGLWTKDERLKEIGSLNLEVMLEGVEAYTLGLFMEGGRSMEETTARISGVQRAYLETCRKNQLYTKVVVVTGRKPGGAK